MSKKKETPEFAEFNEVLRQVQETLPGPALPPDDPAAGIQAIDDWGDEWLAMHEGQAASKRLALSKDLRGFIERTNYLAHWCESLGLDSSPLVQFYHEARQTYLTLRPKLPPVPDDVWVLLDRLRFRLQPISPHSSPRTKKRITKEELDFAIRKYLREHPKATVTKVAEVVGWSRASVSQSAAWKVNLKERRAKKQPIPKAPRQLHEDMLAVIGDDDDPSARLEAVDSAWKMLWDSTSHQDRPALNAMLPEDREELVRLFLEQQIEQQEQDSRRS